MTETMQEFTFQLPQDVADLLWKAARERRETSDYLVAEALRFSLQPLRQEVLGNLQHQIRQQQTQSESELHAHLGVRLSAAEEERLSQLLECNRAEGLTPQEQTEMQTLFDRIEAIATEKAAAIHLLSDRAAKSAML